MIKSAIFAGKLYSAATYEQVARKIAEEYLPDLQELDTLRIFANEAIRTLQRKSALLGELLRMIEDGALVRNTRNDDDLMVYVRESAHLASILKQVQQALDGVPLNPHAEAVIYSLEDCCCYETPPKFCPIHDDIREALK